jgi:uncharacterized protein
VPSNPRFPRNVASALRAALKESRVVALTGARQTGKTTLARAEAERAGGRYVTLDDEAQRVAVARDPLSMLTGPYPLVIDEFQLGGDALLRAVKRVVDGDDTPGRFLLTGSAHFLMLPTISESLAGRVALVDLWPFSQGELRRRLDRFADRLFGPTAALRSVAVERLSPSDAYAALGAGGYPEVQRLSTARRRAWFSDYVRTITRRDVPAFADLRRADELPRLLRLLAARTAGELNLNEVGRELGMPRSSLDAYVAMLELVGLFVRVPAWSRNLTNKVIRHSKGHVTDAGLAAALLGVGADALADPTHRARGPLLESFVATELAKQRTWAKVPFELHHFRDRALFEVDLVLEADDGRVAAVEVKASQSVGEGDLRGLDGLASRLGDTFTNGVVLYLGSDVIPLGPRRTAMPISALWAP